MDLVILYDEKNQFHINRAMKLLDGVKNVHTVTTTDPFNIEIEKETGTALKGRKVFWLSQCTQQNFMTAFEKFGAAFIGFANQ